MLICTDTKLVVVAYLALPLSIPKFTLFGDNRNIWKGGRVNYFHCITFNILILSVSFLAPLKGVNLPIRSIFF